MRYLNIDLDGVMVDFYGTAERHLGRPYKGLTGAEAWGVLDKVPRLFRDMPPLPDAMQLWAGLQAFAAREGYTLRVLSAFPKPTGLLVTAQEDKRHWVRTHLGETLEVVLVARGEWKFAEAEPGDILIDDLERNILAWGRVEGTIGILHTSAADTLQQLNQILTTEN